jgi:hypothetical protein
MKNLQKTRDSRSIFFLNKGGNHDQGASSRPPG